MTDIKTYPEMNEKIKDLLALSDEPHVLYARQRIIELEEEVKSLRRQEKKIKQQQTDQLIKKMNELERKIYEKD